MKAMGNTFEKKTRVLPIVKKSMYLVRVKIAEIVYSNKSSEIKVVSCNNRIQLVLLNSHIKNIFRIFLQVPNLYFGRQMVENESNSVIATTFCPE